MDRPHRYERIGQSVTTIGGRSLGVATATLFAVLLLCAGFTVYAVIVGLRTADIQQRMATIVTIPVNASCGGSVAETRRALAYQKRIDNSHAQYSVGVPCHTNNGDEDLYAPVYFASFSKGLQHDSLGHVVPSSYLALKKAALGELPSYWDGVPLAPGATLKLTNPQSGNAFVNEGADSRAFYQKPAPTFASAQAAGEIVELYWMALSRDVSFADYTTHPTTIQAAASIALLSDYRGHQPVSTTTLFRGKAPGCEVGPYISQFLYMPCPFGANWIDQKMTPLTPGVNFMTNFTEYLRVQNGQTPAGIMTYLTTPRYIINGRDLAHWVHVDVLL